MTKAEREKIKVAIEELCPGGNYHKGLDILYRLVGYGEHPALKAQRTGKSVPIGEIPITRCTT